LLDGGEWARLRGRRKLGYPPERPAGPAQCCGGSERLGEEKCLRGRNNAARVKRAHAC